MGLPSIDDAKAYCRVQTTAEDAVFTSFLTRAKAKLEARLGYPLVATEREDFDFSRVSCWQSVTEIRLKGPFDEESLVVEDFNGDEVDADTYYYADPRNWRIVARDGYCFDVGPYTLTADVGLDAHPDYARIEELATTAILELVAHWHINRNPAMASETDEGGGSISLVADADAGRGLPPRILECLTAVAVAAGETIA